MFDDLVSSPASPSARWVTRKAPHIPATASTAPSRPSHARLLAMARILQQAAECEDDGAWRAEMEEAAMRLGDEAAGRLAEVWRAVVVLGDRLIDRQ